MAVLHEPVSCSQSNKSKTKAQPNDLKINLLPLELTMFISFKTSYAGTKGGYKWLK